MSYGELVKELKLEDRIIAVTRVSSQNEKLNDVGGCIYKSLGRVLAGETLVLGKGSCSCAGFDHNSGLKDERPMIPGGFGVFLSKGSDQMWTPPGERFKCDPQTAEAMFENRLEQCVEDFAYRLQSQGLNLETYLKYTNSNIDDFKKSFRPQAEMQVKYRLALEKIVELENITPDEKDIEEQYKKMAEDYGVELEKVKAAIPASELSKDIAVGKAIDLVKENAVITEVEQKSEEEKKPAAKKAAAKKPAAKKTAAKKTEEKSAE